MRKIKFRGWHTVANKMFSAEEMASDQLTLLTTGLFINVSGADTRLSVVYGRDKFIPLQFTGLHDKHGKEIYESDIVDGWVSRWPDLRTRGFIQYNIHAQAFQLRYENFFNGHANEFMHHYHFFEVVGNIYQHPELLTQPTTA